MSWDPARRLARLTCRTRAFRSASAAFNTFRVGMSVHMPSLSSDRTVAFGCSRSVSSRPTLVESCNRMYRPIPLFSLFSTWDFPTQQFLDVTAMDGPGSANTDCTRQARCVAILIPAPASRHQRADLQPLQPDRAAGGVAASVSASAVRRGARETTVGTGRERGHGSRLQSASVCPWRCEFGLARARCYPHLRRDAAVRVGSCRLTWRDASVDRRRTR